VKGRWIPRPITAEEADVVREALKRAPVKQSRAALLESVSSLVVVDRCKCGCASVDFESNVAAGSSTSIASALGKTPGGTDVGIIVWGDDEHVTGLEIYDFEPESSMQLPTVESIRPFESR